MLGDFAGKGEGEADMLGVAVGVSSETLPPLLRPKLDQIIKPVPTAKITSQKISLFLFSMGLNLS